MTLRPTVRTPPRTTLRTTLWKRHGLLFAAGTLCVLANTDGLSPLWFTGLFLLAVGGTMRWTLTRRQRPTGDHPPVPMRIPVEGPWTAHNSPADKVPSHTHSHAQTYAIDLIHHPAEGPEAPPFTNLWPLARRPEHYPTFGQPVLAPADGVVVATAHRMRDHWTRSSLPSFAYLYLEGFVRSLGWPCHLWGNYILLDTGDNVVAGFAHLRRGSLRVRPGDHVRAGQHLADCGNSGNSSEPHLHFQLMTTADPTTAQGVPFTWHYHLGTREPRTGIPSNTTLFTA
ncbi:M23 family metallopeptidase [Streptomyces vinaceus]|uniref:M23 family metallopeptidase n=1 Tax=Streptomyces vinaceus TaxID=1960 RepID=A0A5J6JD48_STRVI|nr:M23 family metallopeptidase [Streptomyces vinaceus]QEV45498.1 M23 family metallopeptidase [Streptomyces vinaceus]GHE31198.1 metalloendopeptidase [Streptomyces vinaceus]